MENLFIGNNNKLKTQQKQFISKNVWRVNSLTVNQSISRSQLRNVLCKCKSKNIQDKSKEIWLEFQRTRKKINSKS